MQRFALYLRASYNTLIIPASPQITKVWVPQNNGDISPKQK